MEEGGHLIQYDWFPYKKEKFGQKQEHREKNQVSLKAEISGNALQGEGFPGGPDGKESICNAGDLGSIPELGRSPGGGHDNFTLVFLPGESPWTEEPGGLRSTGSQRAAHS